MEYRTRLGTRFYDRFWELEELHHLLEKKRTLIVYGPRNIGKSELIRYYLEVYAPQRLGRIYAVRVDARERRVERCLGGGEPRGITTLSRAILEALRMPPSLVELVERVIGAVRRSAAEKIILHIDEFHLFYGDRREALRELESLAGYAAKKGEDKLRLVITVSEGFVASGSARRRLLGYARGSSATRKARVGRIQRRAGNASFQEACRDARRA